MKRDSLSVSMARALDAWHLRPDAAKVGANYAQIETHAVAHGVSVSGLYLALVRCGAVEKGPKRQRVAAPA